MSEEKKDPTVVNEATNPQGNVISGTSGLTEVKFEEWIKQGFDLFKDNAVVLIVAGLIVGVLSSVTMGILAGPLLGGFFLMILRLLDGEKVEIGEVFHGFQYFLPTFLFTLVFGIAIFFVPLILGHLPVIGGVAAPLGALVLETFVMFALPLIVDRKLDFWAASMRSVEIVKQLFWPLLGLHVLVSIIAFAGVILCGIGTIFTAPLAFCVLIVVYRAYFPAEPTSLAN